MYLVWVTAYPLSGRIPRDIMVQLDPLVGTATMLASRSYIPEMALSLVVVAMTVILGRVFCGWVCPLGTTLDLSDKVLFRKRTRRGVPDLRRVKYYILAGLLMTAAFTLQAVYLLDPLSLITRTVVIVFVAPIQMAFRWLAELSYGWSSSDVHTVAWIGTWLSDRIGTWRLTSGPQMYFRQGLLVLAIFGTIIGLNSISRRFWCRNLCPLGALLGLLSYIPIMKRVVGSGCTECSKCTRECKMGAIPQNPRLTRASECIECFDCVEVCPQDVVSFGLRPKPEFHGETSLDLSRRRLLLGASAGLGFAAMAAIDPGRKRALENTSTIKLSSHELIRPPGSRAEEEFVARCTRCGLCMKACPTNGLQPSLHEAGIEGFWTPILVPRIGCCTQECNACGEVCPTDAISPFKIEEKTHIYIGTAGIDRSRCIAWYADKQCLVCDEYCSYKAIEWKTVDGAKRPFVNERKCVGCGICESACPIQPTAAIRVYSHGDKRHMTRAEQAAYRGTDL